MNPQDFTLSEISQSQRQILYDSTHMRCVKVVKFIETENKIVVTRGARWGGKRGSCCLMGVEFPNCKMKSSGDWLHNNVSILNTTELYI